VSRLASLCDLGRAGDPERVSRKRPSNGHRVRLRASVPTGSSIGPAEPPDRL